MLLPLLLLLLLPPPLLLLLLTAGDSCDAVVSTDRQTESLVGRRCAVLRVFLPNVACH